MSKSCPNGPGPVEGRVAVAGGPEVLNGKQDAQWKGKASQQACTHMHTRTKTKICVI